MKFVFKTVAKKPPKKKKPYRRRKLKSKSGLRKAPRGRQSRTLRPRKPYRSFFEEKLASDLKGSGAKYETEKLGYTVSGNYVPDWTLPNGVIIEAKGVLDPQTKKKMLAVRKEHPDRIICIVFQRASNKFNKKSATTYGDWATKNNFLWSDGQINPEWLGFPKPIKKEEE